MNRLLFICILTAVMGVTCEAQEPIVSDEYIIIQRMLQRFSQINDNIRFMSNRSSSLDNRNYYKSRALSLFIAHGDSYEIDSIQYNGATIEIKNNLRPRRPNRKRIKDFFSGIVNFRYIADNLINEVCYINLYELKEISENKYTKLSFHKCEIARCQDKYLNKLEHNCKYVDAYLVGWEHTIDGKEPIILLGHLHLY